MREKFQFNDHSEVFDFIIGEKIRSSHGKGFKAITHSAITIGLLEYCMSRDMPHPGFVVLDSPLRAYKEPEEDEEKLLKGSELDKKFYEYLIKKHGSNQIIIIENDFPLDDNAELNRIHFTRNPKNGRFGFLPVDN